MSGSRYSNCSILIGAIATLFLVVLSASPALAQTNSSSTQDEWQVAVAIYLWGTDID